MSRIKQKFAELTEELSSIKEDQCGGRYGRSRGIAMELLQSANHLSYRESDTSILSEFEVNFRGKVSIWQFLWDARPALVGSRQGLQGRMHLRFTYPSHSGPCKFTTLWEMDNRRRDGHLAPKGESAGGLLRMQEQAAAKWDDEEESQKASLLKQVLGLHTEADPMLRQEAIAASEVVMMMAVMSAPGSYHEQLYSCWCESILEPDF